MYGFIVTSHYDFYDTITKCLDLLFKYIPDNSFILLYVNEPKGNKMLNIENDYKQEKRRFKVIFIEDQNKNGGLSGVWNQGIDFFLYPDSFDYIKFPMLKNFKCKVITILGHDTYINENIKYIILFFLHSFIHSFIYISNLSPPFLTKGDIGSVGVIYNNIINNNSCNTKSMDSIITRVLQLR